MSPMNMWALQLRQKTDDDQGNNNDGEHVDKAACVRNAGNDGPTEETEQQIGCQDQDNQLKH